MGDKPVLFNREQKLLESAGFRIAVACKIFGETRQGKQLIVQVKIERTIFCVSILNPLLQVLGPEIRQMVVKL